MKGYFSQLAHNSGLTFEPGGRTSFSTMPTVGAQRESHQGIAPMHVDAVTFTTPSRSPTPAASGESNDDVAAIAPAGAIFSTGDVSRAVNPSVDVSVTPAHDASMSQPKARDANPERTSEPRLVTFSETHPEFTFEEERTSFAYPESRTNNPQEFSAEERLPAGKQQMVEVPEEPSPKAANPTPDSAPQTKPDTRIEISSLTLPGESRNRVAYADSGTSPPGAYVAEQRSPTGEREMVEFSEEPSPDAREFPATELLEVVEEFESQFMAPEYALGDLADQNQPAHRPQAEGQLLQPSSRDPRPGRITNDAREPEVIVRNYMNEVRAWVAATPAIDESASEQDDWEEALQGRRDVLTFEHETEATSLARNERTAAPGVQDVSLSIGSISIVIEEPKKDISIPAAAPLSVERSQEQAGREPTSLSRYYLRTW